MRGVTTNRLLSAGMLGLFGTTLLLVWDWFLPVGFLQGIPDTSRHLIAFLAAVIAAWAVIESFRTLWKREIRGGLRWAVRQVQTESAPRHRTTGARGHQRESTGTKSRAKREELGRTLQQTTLTWSQAETGTDDWVAKHGGHSWSIHLNDFPAHDLYTLRVDGREATHFNDWPTNWIRLDHAPGATPLAFCDQAQPPRRRRILFARVDDTTMSAISSTSAAGLERLLQDRITTEVPAEHDCILFLNRRKIFSDAFLELETSDHCTVYGVTSGNHLRGLHADLTAFRGPRRAEFIEILRQGHEVGSPRHEAGPIGRALDSGVFPSAPDRVLEAAAATAALYHLCLGAILAKQGVIVLMTEPKSDTSSARRMVSLAGS